MSVKIAFAGDLHKRSKDITTIEGYVNCTIAVQKSLMKLIKDLNIDYFISLGDWYDKGYAVDVAASLADYDIDIQMSQLLKGNFYGLIGNHIRLNMDSNPELHIIQPHSLYKSRRASLREEQIMKTPDLLRINDVQISFMHHKKDVSDALMYKPNRREWAKYHIALFHTPAIVPNAQLVSTRYGYNSSSNLKISQTLEGVELAIVGDIHTPLGQFAVNTKTGQATMIVPGSLTNTDSSEENRHTSIMIPILTIEEDSTVKLEYYNFDMKTNLLTFKKKNVEASRARLKTLRGNVVKELHESEDVVAVLGGQETVYTSLNAFMQVQQYTEKDKKLIRQVIDNPEDLDSLVRLYRDDEIFET